MASGEAMRFWQIYARASVGEEPTSQQWWTALLDAGAFLNRPMKRALKLGDAPSYGYGAMAVPKTRNAT